MIEVPDRTFGEMLTLYQGRCPEKTQDNTVKPEILNISDINDLKAKMASLARTTAKKFDNVSTNDWGWESDYGEEGNIKRIPITYEVVDASVPLSFIIFRSFNNLRGSKKNRAELNIALVKADLSAVDSKSVDKGWFKENEVGSVTYAHSGTDFKLEDRFVPPKYRNQDFGSIVFEASEEFIREYANDKQKECTISVSNAMQLQVMRWLWKHGFTPEDEQKLADIFNGDERFILQSIENWDHVVLEKTPEGFKSGGMFFEKKYKPGMAKEVAKIKQATKRNVDGLNRT